MTALYCASSFEPDVTFGDLVTLKGHIKTCLPRANSKKEALSFRSWSPGDPLERSPLGFDQARSTCPVVVPDLILTPLLGFDRQLNRLGQGAGHYDRAFAQFPAALRIGVAWSVQEWAAIPCDPWDLPLDAIRTEQEWISAPNGRLDTSYEF